MEALAEKLKAVVERCKARQDDPTFQENAARLAKEMAEHEAHAAEVSRAMFLRQSGIPQEHWEAIAKPRLEPALRAVAEFLTGPEELRFLVLAGPKGRGKSFALSHAVDRRHGTFVHAHDLVVAGSFDRAFWVDLEATPLLAIDELGAEHGNDAYEANLYALLNARYARLRKTVIATNLDGAAFKARYLAAGLDRLMDRLGTAGRWVTVPGASLRRPWNETDKENEP